MVDVSAKYLSRVLLGEKPDMTKWKHAIFRLAINDIDTGIVADYEEYGDPDNHKILERVSLRLLFQNGFISGKHYSELFDYLFPDTKHDIALDAFSED